MCRTPMSVTLSEYFVLSYWKRQPTGQEWVVQSALAINHGALGVVPWNDPTTDDIKASSSAFAKALPQMKEFILSPSASFQLVVSNRMHVGVWTVGRRSLILATNLNYNTTSFALASIRDLSVRKVSQVFNSGAKLAGKEIELESVGTGAFIVS